MPPGSTFERIYLAIREGLASGAYLPGSHLEPAALGEILFASLTPVRDALHRLVGERMVEASRNEGFRVPRPTEAELRSMYGWRLTLLDVALRQRKEGAPAPAGPDFRAPGNNGPVTAARHLFDDVARRAGSREIEAALVNISDRLGLVAGAEGAVIGDADAELAVLHLLYGQQDWPGFRRAIARWHRKRQRLVPLLLERASVPRIIHK